ncbi:MAG: T9SS type A sorting domain-containing protein [Balneolaceae bacterium]
MRSVLCRGLAISCALLLLTMATLSAQTDNPALFEIAGPPETTWASKKSGEQRALSVQLNRTVLEQIRNRSINRFQLETFEENRYQVDIQRVIEYPTGGWSFIGAIDGSHLNTVTLSIADGIVLSGIRDYNGHHFYKLQFDPARGSHLLTEVDPHQDDELSCGTHDIPLPEQQELPELEYTPKEPHLPQEASRIDVMIIYTPAAENWASQNVGGIDQVIMESMSNAQAAIDNSGLNLQFRLVHAARVDYTEYESSDGSFRDLQRLTSSPSFQPWPEDEGYIDEVHDMRDEYGADLVSMFTLANDVGGLGWLLNSVDGLPHYGFSISRVQQAASFTHVHEMGHNLGNHHSRDQAAGAAGPEGGLHEYSTGWRWIGQNGLKYASVMTYTEGDLRAPHFSNPNVEYQGTPTGSYSGTHAPADNVRSMDGIRHIVANYRPSRLSDSPPVVETLPVSGIGASFAQTGARVTDNGGSWLTELGICWGTEPDPGFTNDCFTAGSESSEFTYSIHGLLQGTTYYTRAYATNQDYTTFGSNRSFTTLELQIPVTEAATDVSAVSFLANWQPSPAADDYLLDLSTDPDFSSYHAGIEQHPVGGNTSYLVRNLSPGTGYFYRIRSSSGENSSEPSGTIVVMTVDIDRNHSTVDLSREKVLATGVQTSTIQVNVLNQKGVPVSGIPVELQAAPDISTIRDNALTTDTEGVARFIVSGENEETVTYRAFAAGLEVGDPVRIEFLNSDGVLTLGHNFPNPFSTQTTIPVTIPEPGRARIEIVNIQGRRVQTVADQTFETGYFEIPFLASELASGVYFCRLITEKGVRTEKLLLVR